jgi:hypothetical protein
MMYGAGALQPGTVDSSSPLMITAAIGRSWKPLMSAVEHTLAR